MSSNAKHDNLCKEIQLTCRNIAILVPYTVGLYRSFQTNKPMQLGVPGVSDLIGFMLDGSSRFVAIEVKTGKGKLRESQIRFKNCCQKYNVIFLVGRNAGEVLKALQALT